MEISTPSHILSLLLLFALREPSERIGANITWHEQHLIHVNVQVRFNSYEPVLWVIVILMVVATTVIAVTPGERVLATESEPEIALA